ncbi:MAG: hypothetical protein QFX35_06770 [Candidatus Verstraetearchaeota archaeon]|nr:hypothetical protein [Candidatus Verstraetearchaeota archaeon]
MVTTKDGFFNITVASVAILLVLTLASSSIAVVKASPGEWIVYDDDESDGGFVSKHLGVKFSIPAGWNKAKILTVKFYVNELPFIYSSTDIAQVRVHVYGANGHTELSSLETTPYQGWLTVDLSGQNIVVDGDFYLTIESLGETGVGIWFDVENPDYRSYYGGPGSWSPPSLIIGVPVDLMIRAEVEQVQTHVEDKTAVGGTILTPQEISIPEGSTALSVPILAYILSLATVALAALVISRNFMKKNNG